MKTKNYVKCFAEELSRKITNQWLLVFQYKATDLVFPGPGKFEITFTPEGGSPQTSHVFTFKKGGGCGMAMYNTDEVNPIQLVYINS